MKLVISPGDSPGSDVLRAVSLTAKALAAGGHLTGEFSRPDAVLAFGTGHRPAYPAPVVQYILDGTEEFSECSGITVFQSPGLREVFGERYSKTTAVVPVPAHPRPGLAWDPRPGAPVICLNHGPDGGVFTGAAACVFPSLLNRPPPGTLMDIAASGVPVLAASSRFIRDFLVDGVSCLLHSPGNRRQLTGQLCHLLENPGLARHLSRNAVEFCGTALSPLTLGEVWNSVLEQVCFR